MDALSARMWEIIRKMFPPQQQEEIAQFLIAECGNNLPFCENSDELQLERLRFAALKLSNGNLDQLLQAIQLAQLDWRDVLMAAHFGCSVTEHSRWADDYLAAWS